MMVDSLLFLRPLFAAARLVICPMAHPKRTHRRLAWMMPPGSLSLNRAIIYGHVVSSSRLISWNPTITAQCCKRFPLLWLVLGSQIAVRAACLIESSCWVCVVFCTCCARLRGCNCSLPRMGSVLLFWKHLSLWILVGFLWIEYV
jgi:hypothetical protein